MFSSDQSQSLANNPLTVQLMKPMKFGDKDLDVNRTGRLSETQIQRFERRYLFLSAILWLWLIGGIIYTLTLMRTNMVIVCVPMTLAFTVTEIFMLLYIGRAKTYVQNSGRAKLASGVLKKRSYFDYMNNHRGMRWRYFVRAEGEEFEVSQHVYEAFIEGEYYALYYEPRFRMLLSAEYQPAIDS